MLWFRLVVCCIYRNTFTSIQFTTILLDIVEIVAVKYLLFKPTESFFLILLGVINEIERYPGGNWKHIFTS